MKKRGATALKLKALRRKYGLGEFASRKKRSQRRSGKTRATRSRVNRAIKKGGFNPIPTFAGSRSVAGGSNQPYEIPRLPVPVSAQGGSTPPYEGKHGPSMARPDRIEERRP